MSLFSEIICSGLGLRGGTTPGRLTFDSSEIRSRSNRSGRISTFSCCRGCFCLTSLWSSAEDRAMDLSLAELTRSSALCCWNLGLDSALSSGVIRLAFIRGFSFVTSPLFRDDFEQVVAGRFTRASGGR